MGIIDNIIIYSIIIIAVYFTVVIDVLYIYGNNKNNMTLL